MQICLGDIPEGKSDFNIQIEATQLHFIQHRIRFHAKGLFPIHNTTYFKVMNNVQSPEMG